MTGLGKAQLTPPDAPVIFEQSVGLSHDISLLLSGFNGVAYFLSSLVPIWLIDRVGRVSGIRALTEAHFLRRIHRTVSLGQVHR